MENKYNYNQTAKQKEPIRLFKSDFLEFFSHISPQVVLVVWIPITIAALIAGVLQFRLYGFAWWLFPILLFAGWFIWTFIEYTLHRFIFHYHPRTERLKQIFFTFHGVHHAQPMCKTRLVMPPVISIPVGIVVLGFYYLICATLLRVPAFIPPLFAGTTFGYIIYDMVHYILHHNTIKTGYLAMCRRQHMRHHVTCPNMRFGVTLPLWDWVFGTMPKGGVARSLKNKSA